jgi:hypothetical protein
MTKFGQRAMIGFFALRGLRPEQIQSGLSEVYDEQAFQLAVVEKWHLRFAEKVSGLEDEPMSGRHSRIDFTKLIASCFMASRSYHARQYVGDYQSQGQHIFECYIRNEA